MTSFSRRTVQIGKHEAQPKLRREVPHARRRVPIRPAVRQAIHGPPRGLKVVDDLAMSVPVGGREIEVLETYLGSIIDDFLDK
jgi:hypothetical protein